ncbi:Rv2732c family membrane protein [Gordonia insulae]|uniref:Transmembrane protein n=1 Tax=Gordonia insulae TaxID=2420509 RepID=A0A3G8JI62_9ACTN|nr:hypothetical protein D7316_00729 [Gordonia insulae]
MSESENNRSDNTSGDDHRAENQYDENQHDETRSQDDARSARADAGRFAEYERDLRKAERKVAGEIDPGMRAVVVAVAVLVAMLALVLPHTGSATGIEVLTFAPDAAAERVTIVSKVFVYFVAIFGIGASVLALLTRRWIVAWIALCGNAIACVAGMLAWWSRNTPGVGGVDPPSGVGIGLVIAWLAVLVLTFHWARVVWARSTYHLALEEERRKEAATRDELARSLQHKPKD